MSPTRRGVLRAVGMLAGASAAALAGLSAPVPARASAARPGGGALALEPSGPTAGSRRIALRSVHTLDALEVVFRRGGEYVPEAMPPIQRLLRDHRTGGQHPIDPSLLDYLWEAAASAGVDAAFDVISGYRSPRTNEMLHERSRGVAVRSLHLEGRAVDVRLAGTDCAGLAELALGMQRGGVGYYRRSDFVHLDTGRFRTWRG